MFAVWQNSANVCGENRLQMLDFFSIPLLFVVGIATMIFLEIKKLNPTLITLRACIILWLLFFLRFANCNRHDRKKVGGILHFLPAWRGESVWSQGTGCCLHARLDISQFEASYSGERQALRSWDSKALNLGNVPSGSYELRVNFI